MIPKIKNKKETHHKYKARVTRLIYNNNIQRNYVYDRTMSYINIANKCVSNLIIMC